jgi:hypothetical protein
VNLCIARAGPKQIKGERSFCRIERLLTGEKEKKEKDWLRELCGDDAKLYDFLSSKLYLDPLAAISKEGLETLIEEAERESINDENYQKAMSRYRLVVDKAIFEATQHQEERGRYIKLIQDLMVKTSQATEKVKEKAEKEGLNDRAASLGRRIEDDKFMSERIEDVIKVASLYYNERLEVQGEEGRGEARREKKLREGMGEKLEEKRDKKQEKARREKRQEDEREEKLEEKREEERGEARREKILETRREEDKTSV